MRGAVDGLQGGVNDARNRAMETKESVEVRTGQFVETLRAIASGGGDNGGKQGYRDTGRDKIGQGEKPLICGGDCSADKGF